VVRSLRACVDHDKVPSSLLDFMGIRRGFPQSMPHGAWEHIHDRTEQAGNPFLLPREKIRPTGGGENMSIHTVHDGLTCPGL